MGPLPMLTAACTHGEPAGRPNWLAAMGVSLAVDDLPADGPAAGVGSAVGHARLAYSFPVYSCKVRLSMSRI